MLASFETVCKNKHCTQCVTGVEGFMQWSEHRRCYEGLPYSEHVDEGCLPDATYVDLKAQEASVVHWGQLKLFLIELTFLEPYKHIQDLCVVYAGSSPGHHLKPLIDMFPSTWKWELYDSKECEAFCEKDREYYEKLGRNPRVNKGIEEHQERIKELDQLALITKRELEKLEEMNAPEACIERKRKLLFNYTHLSPIIREHRTNVTVHTKPLTSIEAELLHARHVQGSLSQENPQLLCISDIRTRTTEEGVMHDMEVQKRILYYLKPYQASLKFKLPYSDSFPVDITYLDGKLMHQPYSRRVSHETRLFTLKGDDLFRTRSYNRVDYAKRLYFFQTNLRTSIYNENDQLADDSQPNLKEFGIAIDRCYDCTAAREIMRKFDCGLEELEIVVEKLKRACDE